MPLLTPEQLQQLQQILRDASTALALSTTGYQVQPAEMQRLVQEGYIKAGAPLSDMVKNGFEFGRLLSRLPAASGMTLQQFTSWLQKNPAPMSKVETHAYDVAKSRAGTFCVGLGNRYSEELGTVLVEADQEHATEVREAIAEETSTATVERSSKGKLRTRLRQLTEDWSRDWDRIAATETQQAHQEGFVEATVEEYGEEELLAKVPEASACDDCKRLYLENGVPMIRPASWWLTQGSNVGLKRANWKPVLGTMHPNCQCQLVRVPKGWEFDENWVVMPPGETSKGFPPGMDLQKAQAAAPGDIHQWAGGSYQKQPGGTWKRLKEAGAGLAGRLGPAAGVVAQGAMAAAESGSVTRGLIRTVGDLVISGELHRLTQAARLLVRHTSSTQIADRTATVVLQEAQGLVEHQEVQAMVQVASQRLQGVQEGGIRALMRKAAGRLAKMSFVRKAANKAAKKLGGVFGKLRSELASAIGAATAVLAIWKGPKVQKGEEHGSMVSRTGEVVEPAGNLSKARKLHYKRTFQGFPISIENRKGSVRHWHDANTGTHGETKFEYPYGYIRLTEGVDGDHVDVFLGSDEKAKEVYVIHQQKAPHFKEFDEDKVMMGFGSAKEAKAAYLRHYDNPKFFGSMTTMGLEEFRKKVHATKAKPAMIKGAQLDIFGGERGGGGWEPAPGSKQGLWRQRQPSGKYRYCKAEQVPGTPEFEKANAGEIQPNIRTEVRTMGQHSAPARTAGETVRDAPPVQDWPPLKGAKSQKKGKRRIQRKKKDLENLHGVKANAPQEYKLDLTIELEDEEERTRVGKERREDLERQQRSRADRNKANKLTLTPQEAIRP